LKNAGIMYMYLRKLHYNVMCRKMQQHEADILAGRAKSVAAQHYILYELDKMVDDYEKAWDMFNIKI
jgi:intergrase/recombinase